MIEGIPEGKDKHRINKHKVRILFLLTTMYLVMCME